MDFEVFLLKNIIIDTFALLGYKFFLYNILCNPLDFTTADTRPATAEDDLTEEEQAARAAQNHSCEGISVSGIDLPWYVQFQVTSGENYEFKNEDNATIL